MENYVLQIIKYYFNDALENKIIKKTLQKKEDKYHIKDKVLAELNELKELITELINIDFSIEQIKEEVEIYVRDSEFLSKARLDMEDFCQCFLLKIKNVNYEKENSIVQNEEVVKKNEIVVSNNTNNNQNEEIIFKNLKLPRGFEKLFIFDFIYEEYMASYDEILNSIRNTDFTAISSKNFGKEIRSIISNLEDKIWEEVSADDYEGIFSNFFSNFISLIDEVTEFAQEYRIGVSEKLEELKMLQKLSKPAQSSFFVGDIYSMATFGVLKGIGSLWNSGSEYCQRQEFKNEQERNFMAQFYQVMEEKIVEFFESMKPVYNVAHVALHSTPTSIQFSELANLKIEFSNRCQVNKVKSKEIMMEMLTFYPLSREMWENFLLYYLNMEEFLEFEKLFKNPKNEIILGIFEEIKGLKILLSSNNIGQIYKALEDISEDYEIEEVKEIFEERFSIKIEKEVFEFFLFVLHYILSEDFNKEKEENTEENFLYVIAELIKNSYLNNLDNFYEKNKIEIFMYIQEIRETAEIKIFREFFKVDEIINFLNKEYKIYIKKIKEETDIKIENLQQEINEELKKLKETSLKDRGVMKYFLLTDYFDINEEKQNKIEGFENVSNNLIHLSWDTTCSLGKLTLSSLIYKNIAQDRVEIIFLKDIKKVKLEDFLLKIETYEEEKRIEIFDKNILTTEKQSSIKALGIYIKNLSQKWKSLGEISNVYIKNHFLEIDNSFSKPFYTMQFVFNESLQYQNYLKYFLKKGFLSFDDIVKSQDNLIRMKEQLEKYKNQSNKIFLYPFTNKKKKEIGEIIYRKLGIKINSNIIAIYHESIFNENKSILVLTEDSLIITTNDFGEIPLNIINEIEIKGFITHSIELQTTKGKVICLLDGSDDSNKVFIELVRDCIKNFKRLK